MAVRISSGEYVRIRRAAERRSRGREADVPEKGYSGSRKASLASTASESRNRASSKYNAKRVDLDGYSFDSMAEASRYSGLRALEKAKHIFDLKVHPTYKFEINGKKMFLYEADFSYKKSDGGEEVIEDVKGVKTPVYRLKKKIIEAAYGVEIVEVKAKEV